MSAATMTGADAIALLAADIGARETFVARKCPACKASRQQAGNVRGIANLIQCTASGHEWAGRVLVREKS